MTSVFIFYNRLRLYLFGNEECWYLFVYYTWVAFVLWNSDDLCSGADELLAWHTHIIGFCLDSVIEFWYRLVTGEVINVLWTLSLFSSWRQIQQDSPKLWGYDRTLTFFSKFARLTFQVVSSRGPFMYRTVCILYSHYWADKYKKSTPRVQKGYLRSKVNRIERLDSETVS